MSQAENVKKLRAMTQAGILDCSKALKENDNDLEKAAEYLRKKGLTKAVKKADREVNDGLVGTVVSEDGRSGAIVEVACETDFVARNEKFQKLVDDIANQVLTSNPTVISKEDAPADKQGDEAWLKENALLEQDAQFGDGTVFEVIQNAIATIGENIQVNRMVRHEVPEGQEGLISNYIHLGGKIGVMVQLHSDSEGFRTDSVKAMTYDLAMHVAATNPPYLDEASVPPEDVAKEKEILTAQLADSGKPENIVEKIVEGRIRKFYEENTLVAQAFVKDPDKTVAQLLEHIGKDNGAKLTLAGFTRFQLGQ